MRFDGFDWDRGNLAKCQKHGVSVSEIEGLFQHSALVAPDIRHSDQEERYFAVGMVSGGRYVFVAFTIRLRGQKILIRPISARYMHKKEVEAHEKEIAKIQD